MANIRKNKAKFGLGGGKYSSKRKNNRQTSGRKRYKYSTVTISSGNTPDTHNILKIVRKQIKGKYIKRARILRQHILGKVYKIYRNKDIQKRITVRDNTVNGYRFINLSSLQGHVSEISSHAALCGKARDIAASGGVPIKLTTELSRNGLASALSARCCGCYKTFLFETSPRLKKDRSSQHYDINVRAVWGSLVTGNGVAHLDEFLACCDSPGMTQRTFSKIESEINQWWKDILDTELKAAIEEEKNIAISKGQFHEGVPAITVICDGGWSKRTHRHTYNAHGGVAIIIGAATKKLLHIGVRNKYCSICQRAANLNEKPIEHVCFKNWNKSSQAMETDIIVEGFLKANEHGIRYINLIGDGDSSVFARIREEIPIWGRHVQKQECANHVVKCLRSNLEKLVDENPSYKGKDKLSKRTRVRITSAVRCAIRMRSNTSNVNNYDKTKAARLLEHDIRNCIYHVFGNHNRCSRDFCKAKDSKDNSNDEINLDENEYDQDLINDQVKYWTDGSSLESQEEARKGSSLSMENLDKTMLLDVNIIMNRVAIKSERLIGNNTTNLAESWMHIRSKFDGGKIYNLCNRGGWHTRCYAGALRFNLGPKWSPEVWEKATNTIAGWQFIKLYTEREHSLQSAKINKSKPEAQSRRWKRKMEGYRESNCKKAKTEYGKEALDHTPDMSSEELANRCSTYMISQVNISIESIRTIEQTTRLQSFSQVWGSERRKRLTSSRFGQVIKRNPKIKTAPLVRDIVYQKFGGNKATKIGLNNEKVAIQEYINEKEKQGAKCIVESMGLVIDRDHKFLAASPDGKVQEQKNGKVETGLIEVKNLLYDKPINLTQAARSTSIKSFCLEMSNGQLKLKQSHNYFYQCHGLMNICDMPWIDFVVRTEKPYEMHIERIYKDIFIWETLMLPKLTAFYQKAILPELSCPRYQKSPGIREPGTWYEETTTKKKKPTDEPDKGQSSTRRRLPKNFSLVGKTISHLWIEGKEEKWYTGLVVRLVKGKDGKNGAVYDVRYKDDDFTYEVNHLVEDYRIFHVKFTDP